MYMEITDVYTILSRHPKNLDEDTIQDLVIKIWEARESYKPDKTVLSTWVYQIVKNHLIDLSRRKKEKENVVTNVLSDFDIEKEGVINNRISDLLASDELSPEEELITQEIRENALNRIKMLPDLLRDTLMSVLSGTYDGSLTTSRVNFHRAMDALSCATSKKQYTLSNIATGETFVVNSLQEAAKIAGYSIETIRQSLKKEVVFGKKSWKISN